MNLWSLEGAHNSYLATSPTGTATGFGADVLMIDDLLKNSKEAFNSRVLDDHWEWFTQTMLSRLEEDAKIIIIMTRWSREDLAGKAKRMFKQEGRSIREIKMKALQDDGTMLAPGILSRQSYEERIRLIGEEVARANYQQEPMDIKGRLYKEFRTYTDRPSRFDRIINYVDTADSGADNLVSIVAGEKDGYGYILDVIYTKDSMEITEPQNAEQLYRFDVDLSYIESNAGGRSYARTVEDLLWRNHKSRKTRVKWFHQSQNKIARILSHSTFVMNNLLFPEDWHNRWPEYYDEMTNFQKEGRNRHDDGADATTGIAEMMTDDRSAIVSSVNVW